MFIEANWPAPANVKTAITLREGGFSAAPFDSNNLAMHVGDDPAQVKENRTQLATHAAVSDWAWLHQVHGTRVVEASSHTVLDADGNFTRTPKLACVVLTADCLPVLLCDKLGTQVAAIHAGWRGLAQGILSNGLKCFSAPKREILAYIGPAISQHCYEVDEPVLTSFRAFTDKPDEVGSFFKPNSKKPGHHFLNLAGAARYQLLSQGVGAVFGGDICTFTDDRFYSYRRDGLTGRFASAIWLA